jgi:hypothetical protein
VKNTTKLATGLLCSFVLPVNKAKLYLQAYISTLSLANKKLCFFIGKAKGNISKGQ